MKLNGETVGVGEPLEVITSGNRGAIPVAPVIQRAHSPEVVQKLNGDVDSITRGGRSLPMWPFAGALALALTAAAVAKVSDSSDKPSEPVRGSEYDDEVLNDEINCLRTWFAAQCSQFTDAGDAFLEQNCDQDALDELGTSPELIALARDGVSESAGINYRLEEWIRGDGNLMNLKIKTWAEPGNKVRVPKRGYPYTKRIYSNLSVRSPCVSTGVRACSGIFFVCRIAA